MNLQKLDRHCKYIQALLSTITLSLIPIILLTHNQVYLILGLLLLFILILINVWFFKHTRHFLDAIKLREDYLSITSHEVKNPLTAVLLQIGLLQRSSTISQFEKERLLCVSNQIRRAVEILNSTIELDFKEDLKMTKQDIVYIIKEISSLYPKCSFDCSNCPIYVIIDECKFRQVIHNLLTNAQKFGKEKGIKISLQELFFQNQFYARIEVQDQGVGIKKEDIPKLFNQNRYRHSQRVLGHGIGFYVIRNLVKLHQGQIGVMSEPEKGTSIIILLPLQKEYADPKIS